MRSQIPKFRLPDDVIDEECGYIIGLGVETRYNQWIGSLRELMAEGWDAVFVGTGAPRGRDAPIPGREEAAKHIHIGIDWLANVAFGHTTKISKRVIVLGGGNTAMDCCRSARRLGGDDVKVIVRSGFEEMKASPWEKEEAIHEGIPIINMRVPKEFRHENGRLTGVSVRDRARRVRRQGPAQPDPDRGARRVPRVRRSPGGDRSGKCLSLDREGHRTRIRQVGHAGAQREDPAIDAAQCLFRR